MAEKIRVHTKITGRVQGVFFRMETQKVAEAHNVCGWVKNNPDGSVEAVFEGEKENVEEVIRWCHQGPPSARVDSLDVSESTYSEEFSRFNVTL